MFVLLFMSSTAVTMEGWDSGMVEYLQSEHTAGNIWTKTKEGTLSLLSSLPCPFVKFTDDITTTALEIFKHAVFESATAFLVAVSGLAAGSLAYRS